MQKHHEHTQKHCEHAMSDCRFARSHAPMNNPPVPGTVLCGFFLFFLSSLSHEKQTIEMESQGRGRHERRRAPIQTTRDVPVLGEDLVVDDHLQELVDDTEEHQKSPHTLRDCRNRLGHMIEFIEEKWPRHCAVGVAELSEEQKAKKNMCCCQNTHDLVHGTEC